MEQVPEAAGLLSAAAPWLAAAFGIATAVFAERAFRAASQAVPPDRWRGDNSLSVDFDMREETQEHLVRDTMNARAGALQSVATFLGAGAAVEAAAASQSGDVGQVLAALGVAVALLPSIGRWLEASREIQFTKAHYIRMQWSVPRKYIASPDLAEEDAAFAKAHPHEAAVLKRQHRSG